MSIPTKIKFTGNQTLTNLHVSGSVDITPRKLNVDTIKTEIKFCTHRSIFKCHQLGRYHIRNSFQVILMALSKPQQNYYQLQRKIK